MDSKLPPLDFKDEEQYEAYNEFKEINFNKCKHSDINIANGELKCKCGVSWSGTGSELKKLFDVLTKK